MHSPRATFGRIAAFNADSVEDLVGYQRKQFFVMATCRNVQPNLSTFQDADLKTLQVRRQVLRGDIDGQQQVQASVV
ncbi:hypothetical protein D3C81_2165360 [compost metagenome]